jgi:hypothetical protein
LDDGCDGLHRADQDLSRRDRDPAWSDSHSGRRAQLNDRSHSRKRMQNRRGGLTRNHIPASGRWSRFPVFCLRVATATLPNERSTTNTKHTPDSSRATKTISLDMPAKLPKPITAVTNSAARIPIPNARRAALRCLSMSNASDAPDVLASDHVRYGI